MTQSVDAAASLLARAMEASRRLPLPEAVTLFRQAEQAYLDAGQHTEAARVKIEEARARARSFDATEVRSAHAALDDAERLLAEAPSDEIRALLLHVRGYAHLRRGAQAQAIETLQEAERAFRSIDSPLGEARVLDTLGVMWERRGDRERAALLLARSHALKQQGNDPEGVAIALGNLGRLAMNGGKHREAEQFFKLDLHLARKQGDQRGEAMVLTNLAECATALGDLDKARSDVQQSIAIAKATDDPVAEGFALLAHADVERAALELEKALAHIAEAERRFQDASMPAGTAQARLRRARVHALAENDVEAARAALGAVRAARAAHVPVVAIEALLEAHQSLVAQKRQHLARRLLMRAQDAAMEAGLEDLVQRIRSQQVGDAARQAAAGKDIYVELDVAAGPFVGRERARIPLRVDGFLGQGAFGVVLLVRDVEEDGSLYALKRMHHNAERVRALTRRLRREFTAMARVPPTLQLVRPLGFGHEDGQPCLLMEYVASRGRHQSLGDLMDDVGRMEAPLVAGVGRDVALGLAAIHAASVVHRDVKPGNVLLDTEGRARLTDYGLAYDVTELEYVPEHGFKGSFGFAAPELCTIAEEVLPPPTPSADLYSLGVMLYRMLTDGWPFTEGTYLDVMRAKLAGPTYCSQYERAPEMLKHVIARLLEPDPAQRIASAAEVAEMLEPLSIDGV